MREIREAIALGSLQDLEAELAANYEG